MEAILYLLVIGFISGLLARIIMPGRDPMGIFKTTILGVIGSFVGAYAVQYLGIAPQGSWQTLAVAVAGSFVVLGLYKFIRNV